MLWGWIVFASVLELWWSRWEVSTALIIYPADPRIFGGGRGGEDFGRLLLLEA